MQTQAQTAARPAAKASAKAAPASVAKPKVQLLAISPETMAAAAKAVAEGEVKLQRASVDLLTSYSKAVGGLKVKGMTAVQYDRQFRPTFDAELAKRVKAKALKESSAKVASSRAKTIVLALANGVKPIVGETVGEFKERASAWLPTAKVGGAPVWEAATKRGPKTGAKRSGGKLANSAGAARDAETGSDERRDMAAALILTGGNRQRAERLCVVLGSYADDFDKWTATILDDAGKSKANAKTKPETALAAALETAKAKAA
jgi:hypothetical protein